MRRESTLFPSSLLFVHFVKTEQHTPFMYENYKIFRKLHGIIWMTSKVHIGLKVVSTFFTGMETQLFHDTTVQFREEKKLAFNSHSQHLCIKVRRINHLYPL